MFARDRSQILFAFAVALAIWLAYELRAVLFLVYLSALFAVVLMPIVEWVRRLQFGRWHPNRALAMVVIAVVGCGLLAVLSAFALPPLIGDLQALATTWPRRLSALLTTLRRYHVGTNLNINSVQQYASNLVGGILGLFKNVVSVVVNFASGLVLTAYFIIDGERAFCFAMSLFAPPARVRLEAALQRAQVRVCRWLIGQTLLMAILGSASMLVFGLMRVKYFYALAVLTGLANLVPIVGPLVMIVLAGGVAAIDSVSKLVGVVVFYLIYNQFETIVLTPRIMRSTVNLPPLAVLIALIVGASLAGAMGALVAVPSAALCAVLVDEYLVYSAPEDGPALAPSLEVAELGPPSIEYESRATAGKRG